MAGAALAWRGTFPGKVLQIDSLSGKQQQALLSKPSLDNTALEANLSAGQCLPKPILVDGQKFLILPLTLKPQIISPWQQGDKEKADKDGISDGRRYTQAMGSCIRTRFTSASLHQRQVPLPAHSCRPTLASLLSKTFNILFSPSMTCKT